MTLTDPQTLSIEPVYFSFDYTKPGGEPEHRIVRMESISPTHIGGYDVDRDDYRQFLVERIEEGSMRVVSV